MPWRVTEKQCYFSGTLDEEGFLDFYSTYNSRGTKYKK